MQVEKKITNPLDRKILKDFIRLIIAFYACLIVLSVYQYIRLYSSGVLDSFINQSLFLLLLHHIGFTALISLFLSFVFNFLENKKPTLGFKTVSVLLLVLLVFEALLIEYYVYHYEILELNILSYSSTHISIGYTFLFTLAALINMGALFYYTHKVTTSFYNIINRMYPLTLILFGLFLTTLTTDKRPINENKTQHLISSIAEEVFDFNKYEGEKEYPLLKDNINKDVLGKYFNLTEEKPSFVFLIIDGLGSDFLGEKAVYKGFTPFLESLTSESLYWKNYLSTSGNSSAAFTSIIGSLPFGKKGFTVIENSPSRNTLFRILQENGYETTFNYGGNSGLNYLDKFLQEEQIDHIIDRKAFGTDYKMQDEDAAGISLGYPDKELFRKWSNSNKQHVKPSLDVFLTLSTKSPFLIPDLSVYENKVDKLISVSKMNSRYKKLVKNNKEIFASLIYMDEGIKGFFDSYHKRSDYKNTIFIVTGSHNLTELPKFNGLSRYKVPLMIYSPLLKAPKKLNSIASHADLAPSIISMLQEKYECKVPEKNAWLGASLINDEDTIDSSKEILLLKSKNNIRDYVKGNLFLSSGNVYQLGEDMALSKADESVSKTSLKESFSYAKAVNKYVTANNRILPKEFALYKSLKSEFTKQEMIWINSVFNGADFDNAYMTARGLAHNNDKGRALLLCRYILTKVPGHADTEILMGRIYAWNSNYKNAEQILKLAIKKYPTYADGYAALLDVYFWSNQNNEALVLEELMKIHNIQNKEVTQKISRARKKLKEVENDIVTSLFNE